MEYIDDECSAAGSTYGDLFEESDGGSVPQPQRVVATNSQGRRYCFTLNNYTDDELHQLHDLYGEHADDIRFLFFQLEQGEEQTPHVQGYVEFKRSLRFNRVKALVSPRAHFERSRGSSADNIAYCSKSDTRIEGPWSYGEPASKKQGERTDLIRIKELVDSGARDAEVWDQCFPAMVKFHRGVAAYKLCKTPPRNWKTEVTVLIGEPGTGKSEYAFRKTFLRTFIQSKGANGGVDIKTILQWLLMSFTAG